MGVRRRFDEFGVFGLGVQDADRIDATKRWGFPNHILLNVPNNREGMTKFGKIKLWLPDNTLDDYLYLTLRVPTPNAERAKNGALLTREYHFCFKDHRDAVNLKFRWG